MRILYLVVSFVVALSSPTTFAESPESILGVSPGASVEDITRAYRQKAKTHHPDMGGNAADFIQLQQAYEYLKNGGLRRQSGQSRQSHQDFGLTGQQISELRGYYDRLHARSSVYGTIETMEHFFNFSYRSDGTVRSTSEYITTAPHEMTEGAYQELVRLQVDLLSKIPGLKDRPILDEIARDFLMVDYASGLRYAAVSLLRSGLHANLLPNLEYRDWAMIKSELLSEADYIFMRLLEINWSNRPSEFFESIARQFKSDLDLHWLSRPMMYMLFFRINDRLKSYDRNRIYSSGYWQVLKTRNLLLQALGQENIHRKIRPCLELLSDLPAGGQNLLRNVRDQLVKVYDNAGLVIRDRLFGINQDR